MSRLFSSRNGMTPKRHSNVPDYRPVIELRVNAGHVAGIAVAKRQLFDADLLPDKIRFTGAQYADSN